MNDLLTKCDRHEFYPELSHGAQQQLDHLKYLEDIKVERDLDESPVIPALSSYELISLIPRLNLVFSCLIRILFSRGLLPFDKYVLLGDDIVIGCETTADKYFELMNYTLGVPIKLAKSFISSNGLLNFANQTYLGLQNISPIPPKEALGSEIAGRMEFARRVSRRWASKPHETLMRLRLMVKPSVYVHMAANMAKGLTFLPLLPLCLHLTLSSSLVGLNRSKAGRSLDPSRTPYGVALGSIGYQVSNAGELYNRTLGITTKESNVDSLNRVHDPELMDTYYAMVIRYIIKSFLHPYLGDARASLMPDLDNAKRVTDKLTRTLSAYHKVVAKKSKYGSSWFLATFFSTPYSFLYFVEEMEAHLSLLFRVQRINEMSLNELSQLLVLVVEKFDPHVFKVFTHPDTGGWLRSIAGSNKGWRPFLDHMEQFQVRREQTIVERDRDISMRFTKYIIRFTKLIHRTPFTLRGPDQSDPSGEGT